MAKEKQQATKILEREYVIPLKNEWKKVPRYKRANKAIKSIKEFLVRHMKIYDRDLNKVKIDKYLNEFVWRRSIKKPPVKIKVKAIKEIDSENKEIVNAELIDFPEKLKFKKLREEKLKKSAIEKAEKKKAEKEEKKTEESTKKESHEKEKEAEKKAATIESQEKALKQTAKKTKHTTDVKSKQPKHQKRKALAK